MQNKLQELTDKLYNEGLSKGKQEAEQILSQAKKEASEILSRAKTESEHIVADALREAQELKSKAENDIKMAGTQAITAIRQSVENSIVAKATAEPLNEAVKDTDFMKDVILTIVKAFNPESAEPVALEIVLPEKEKKEFDKFLASKLQKICSDGLSVTYSKSIGNGFKIGPKEGGYLISFTDEEFNNLISQYLRPKTRNILFG